MDGSLINVHRTVPMLSHARGWNGPRMNSNQTQMKDQLKADETNSKLEIMRNGEEMKPLIAQNQRSQDFSHRLLYCSC